MAWGWPPAVAWGPGPREGRVASILHRDSPVDQHARQASGVALDQPPETSWTCRDMGVCPVGLWPHGSQTPGSRWKCLRELG